MGKLSHIMAKMEPPENTADGIVKQIGDILAASVTKRLSEDMSRGGESLHAIKSKVGALEPCIRECVSAAVKEIANAVYDYRSEVKGDLDKTQKSLTANQQAIMQSLAGMKFPDHSDQMTRIERKNVDLSPLERKLEAILLKMHMDEDDEEERPRKWRFDIERNKNGLITDVIAEAID